MQLDILLSQTGELSPGACKELEKHLEECGECRKYRDSMERIMSAAREALPAAEPGEAVMARIRSAAREEAERKIVFFPQYLTRWVSYAAAAAFVICGIGLWSFNHGQIHTAGQMSAIAMAMGSEADLHVISLLGKAESERELQALASHLLMMEGFAVDELPEPEPTDAFEEPLPTALQLHNTDGPGQKRCV